MGDCPEKNSFIQVSDWGLGFQHKDLDKFLRENDNKWFWDYWDTVGMSSGY